MRKLGPTRVSYKDDYLISYRVYMMMGHFISRLFEGAIQNRKHYACATRASPSADRFHTKKGGRFAFTGYRCEILVQQPGWTHALVTRAGVKFVAYQVNKRRARRGDRSELAPARKSPRCHKLLLFVACKSALKHFCQIVIFPSYMCLYKMISRIRYPCDTTILTHEPTLGKRAAVTGEARLLCS